MFFPSSRSLARCSRFGPYGLRREAFGPCYGLAESTLLVTYSQGLFIKSFSASRLASLDVVSVPDGSPGPPLRPKSLPSFMCNLPSPPPPAPRRSPRRSPIRPVLDTSSSSSWG